MKIDKNNEGLNVGKNALLVLCVVSLLIPLSGCDDDDDNNVQPVDVAYVSLYNASPNSPDLDIVVDNRLINLYPLNYSDHTGYLRFFTGERNLKFSPYSANNVIVDTVFTLEPNNAYSIFIADTYESAEALLMEDNTEAPAEGNAKIRFINLSPDAPEVNLSAEGEDESFFNDISFKESTEFKEVAAEEYDFQIMSTEQGQALLDVPDISLQPGWYYTFLVRGFQSPPSGNQNVLSAEVIVN
jgi:hypothetical protein